MEKGYLALALSMLMGLLLVTALPAVAQTSNPIMLEEIETAYRRIEYERAEFLAREALQNYGQYTVAELADIHTILALIAYNRGQLEAARRQFISALQLSPSLELDPALVPPKIVSYFEDLKTELIAGNAFPTEAALRYVLVTDPRVDAALRSMVIPGWGQYYKGQDRRAGLFAGLFGLTAGGAIFYHFKMESARDRYEDAVSVADAERLYGTYNRYYRTQNGLAQGALVVWVASYLDALITPAPRIDDGRFGLTAQPNGFTLRVTF